MIVSGAAGHRRAGAGGRPGVEPRGGDHPADRDRGTWPRSPTRCAPTTPVPAKPADAARRRQHLDTTVHALESAGEPTDAVARLRDAVELPDADRRLLDDWPATVAAYSGDEQATGTGGRRFPLTRLSLAGTRCPGWPSPATPITATCCAGCGPRTCPDGSRSPPGCSRSSGTTKLPARMFAGEGGAARTNRRFHLLAADQPATRLSTAFDSVTLYGADPDERPDIYGKVGNAGVSVATLDDMEALYSGFDLSDPSTSVSMTINGPAPTILAMFLNTAIDQRIACSPPSTDGRRRRRRPKRSGVTSPCRAGHRPGRHPQRGPGPEHVHLLDRVLPVDHGRRPGVVHRPGRAELLLRLDFGLPHRRGGREPHHQLAFTLANGFTYVEAYLARGMAIDEFAPNLSFFFSNGMDPEYSVLGRVARRIWAVAMRDRYGAGERSQKLKYHVQTSGRSLHAQEMAFNDIRTTLQALIAIYDNCNSLHTNAYDEAVTTPTEESVRRALAIQLIINREWGLAMNENPNQGSFIIEELTELVEQAVLDELDRLSERGGVLGAMETGLPARAASRTSRCSTNSASTTEACRSSVSTRSATRCG